MKLRVVSFLSLVFLASPQTTHAKPGDKPASSTAPKSLAQTLTGEAKVDYDTARLLAGDGDYAGAFMRFQSAFDLSHDARLLWNLAACQKNLRHYSKVIDLVNRYLAEAGAALSAQDRKDALDLIQALDTFTTLAKLEVSEPGAELFVDDDRLGVSPFPDRVRIDVGNRRIRARKEGFLDYDKTVPVGGAPEVSVDVKLEKEVHEGKLVVSAPANAQILVDGKSAGSGKAELTVSSGGHTLRVTAPGMRAYEREVTVKDKETRDVEVTMEIEPAPEKPRLRVAVGCGDAEPRGTDDGLTIYVDGSPAAAAATGGKKTWSSELGRNRIDFVEFPVDSGVHRVLVRIAGCAPLETSVEVTPIDGAEIYGALHSESSFIARGPAGNPNWGRIGLAVWLPAAIGSFSVGLPGTNGTNNPNLSYDVHAAGVLVQPGLTFRWFSLALDFAYADGSATPTANQSQLPAGAADTKADLQWTRLGFRTGARLPLNLFAFNLGVASGYDHFTVNHLPPGFMWNSHDRAYVGAWSSLDVQVLCDWAAFGGAQLDGYIVEEIVSIKQYSVQFGVAYQPNRTCNTERTTDFSLHAVSSSGKPAQGSK